ncbi:hypothetical protein [Escherichia Stx1 converting phage]|uniref:Uncharacterized protein n=1 Tax=Escherichia phage Stx2 II TaxID=194949 RepID=Q7Y2L2_9CAUD|nr:hypothetical protein Stx1_p121 [Escherichia Stx1 converting phage]NP_859365.1 hypothetical protein Stx2II_p120 [Escherichia phage Stx2 II]BAC77936.1 hypothetical protein [Escherichia Stx1 converting phage]BAC78102.1 hypothetical protein [Escherichia phage Stx2 II]
MASFIMFSDISSSRKSLNACTLTFDFAICSLSKLLTQIEFIQELICMQDSSLENFRSRSTLNKKGRTSATFHLLNLFSLT